MHNGKNQSNIRQKRQISTDVWRADCDARPRQARQHICSVFMGRDRLWEAFLMTRIVAHASRNFTHMVAWRRTCTTLMRAGIFCFPEEGAMQNNQVSGHLRNRHWWRVMTVCFHHFKLQVRASLTQAFEIFRTLMTSSTSSWLTSLRTSRITTWSSRACKVPFMDTSRIMPFHGQGHRILFYFLWPTLMKQTPKFLVLNWSECKTFLPLSDVLKPGNLEARLRPTVWRQELYNITMMHCGPSRSNWSTHRSYQMFRRVLDAIG